MPIGGDVIINGWVKTEENEWYRLEDVTQFRSSEYGVQMFLKGDDHAILIYDINVDSMSDKELEEIHNQYLERMMLSINEN